MEGVEVPRLTGVCRACGKGFDVERWLASWLLCECGKPLVPSRRFVEVEPDVVVEGG